MPIANHRETNSLQRWPSPTMRRIIFHRTHGPRLFSQVCCTGLTIIELINFSIFDLGRLTPGSKVTKGEMNYCPPRSTILQNFSPIAQTVFEICVTKAFQPLALFFDPSRSSKVKSDGVNRKRVGPTYKRSQGSNLVSVTVFEIFRVKILTADLLTLARLTPGPKVTKRGDELLFT